MKLPHCTVEVDNYQKARRIASQVQIGHYFVFSSTGVSLPDGRGRLARLLLKRAPHGRVMPLWKQPIALPGVTITPIARTTDPVASVVTERDLYRAEHDAVHVFIAMPSAELAQKSSPQLVVEYAGDHFCTRDLDLSSGVTIETLAMLLPGAYTAQLHLDGRPIGHQATFTVAEYTLAPLTGRLIEHQLQRQANQLHFVLAVDSYQVPFADAMRVSLVESGQERDSIELEPSEPGRYRGTVAISGGDGPLRLRLSALSDAERVAEVAIPGSRASERDLTVVSELGTEQLFSLMPEPGALPVRGGYLSQGDSLATPLTVANVVSDDWIVDARADIDSLVSLRIDLDRAEMTVTDHGDCKAGSQIAVDSGSPAGLVVFGGLVGGRPFEGYTTFLRPNTLEVSVSAATTVRPQSDLTVEIVTNRQDPVPVLLSVRDQRLTATDTPKSRLAAAIKTAVASATSGMDKGALKTLEEVMPLVPSMRYDFTRGRPSALPGASASAPSMQLVGAAPELGRPGAAAFDGAAGVAPQLRGQSEFAGVPATPGLAREAGDHIDIADPKPATPEVTAQAEAPRSEFPEVLFYGIVPVSGRERVTIAVADSLGTFAIEAFALSGGDWTQAEAVVTVDQPVRADLELPPAVHPGDRVVGRLRVASASGRARVSLTRDGQPLALSGTNSTGQPAELAASAGDSTVTTPAQLNIDVTPGRYVATVQDLTSGETDSVTIDVAVPGVFRSYNKELGLLQPGDVITLDSADALGLRVLPALKESFAVLVEATASYRHLCCEQTAAKIMSAAFMYLTADTLAQRLRAEEIILAGIARERRMLRPGRGFVMYPNSDYISDYYSQLAVRYLWALDDLERAAALSRALRGAVRDGLDMADEVAQAHRMERMPSAITTMEEAYAAAATKAGALRTAVRGYIETQLDLTTMQPRQPHHAVHDRASMAYAAAALIALGDWEPAIAAANSVTRQFNEGGMLYSTVDSVAAIVLMIQLRAAGLAGGDGRVRVNGRDMTTAEASAWSEQIESIEVLDGVAAVEVLRMVEEDWQTFRAGPALKVGFRDRHGNKKRSFRSGDRADLVVSLPDGYEAGDLVHVSLPACMSWIHGGGRVKRFTVDFAGRDRVAIPVAVTAPLVGPQHFAVCVRNMFVEERAASPGLIAVQPA